jgi:hypothetical protein
MAAVVEMTSDEARLWKGMQRIINQQDKLDRGLGRISKGSRKAFSLGPLKRYAATLLGVGGVAMGLRTVIGLFDQYKERARSAGNELYETEANIKRIIQISGGDPAKQAGMLDTAGRITRERGIPYSESTGLVFRGRSVGFTKEDIETFGAFKEFSKDIGSLIDAAGGLKKAFGPTVAGGTPRSIVNALLAGAEQSKVGVETIAQHVLTPAQLVKQQGGNFAELLAALGIAGHGLKTTDEIATQMKALAKTLSEDKRLKGLGLLGGAEALAEMPEARRAKILSNVRARSGFGLVMQNIDEIRAIEQEIKDSIAKTGTPESRIAQARRLFAATPELVALTEHSKAVETRKLIEQQKLGAPELTVQTVMERMRTMLVEQGVGPFAQQLSLKFAGMAERFAHDPRKAIEIGESVLKANFPAARLHPGLDMGPEPGAWRFGPSAVERRMVDEQNAIRTGVLQAWGEIKAELLGRLERAASVPTLGKPDSDPR